MHTGVDASCNTSKPDDLEEGDSHVGKAVGAVAHKIQVNDCVNKSESK